MRDDSIRTQGPGCRCSGTRKERSRWWCVWRRNYTQSAFNGYRRAWSAKSDVVCEKCGASWRTAAKYVMTLPDYDSAYFLATGEFRLSPRARAAALAAEGL